MCIVGDCVKGCSIRTNGDHMCILLNNIRRVVSSISLFGILNIEDRLLLYVSISFERGFVNVKCRWPS